MDEIIAIIGTVLIFLDVVLGYTTPNYRRYLLLPFGAFFLGIALILVCAGIGTGALT